ncbi:MAG: phosphatidylserine decarboxylase [Fibrobacterota bacterium]
MFYFLLKPWILGISLFSGLFAGFSAIFFRDPERSINAVPGDILSPADGRVISVSDENDEYAGPGARRISIFMSPFNVHVNRAPASGQVEKIEYHPGRFLGAFRDKASLYNEQVHIGMDMQGRKIRIKLIAGFLARRIVWGIKEKDTLAIGQRIAFIRFGSRADLILPAEALILVRTGDRVKAGMTLIARLAGPEITGE